MEINRMRTALQRGDEKLVAELLRSGYLLETPLEDEVTERAPDGTVTLTHWDCTALHLAVRYNHPELVQLLYKSGCDTDAECYETVTRFGPDGQPLGPPQKRTLKPSSISIGLELREMTLLLNRLRAMTKRLKDAVTQGTAQQVAECLNEGTPPDLPIQWSEKYLNQGVPEQMTFSGTLLHYAVAKAQLDKIRVLLAFGANAGQLLSFSTLTEDLLTGKRIPKTTNLSTSTLTLAARTGIPEVVTLIESASLAQE